jgi:hypothetical protein
MRIPRRSPTVDWMGPDRGASRCNVGILQRAMPIPARSDLILLPEGHWDTTRASASRCPYRCPYSCRLYWNRNGLGSKGGHAMASKQDVLQSHPCVIIGFWIRAESFGVEFVVFRLLAGVFHMLIPYGVAISFSNQNGNQERWLLLVSLAGLVLWHHRRP